MAPGIDAQDQARILQPVEAERPGGGDDHAPVDQPPAGGVLRPLMLVEVHLGGVLVEAGGHLGLGLLHHHAVHMVDPLPHRIVLEGVGRARQGEVVAGEVQPLRQDEVRRRDEGGRLRRAVRRCRGGRVALSHHHPAHIGQDRLAPLVGTGGADIDDPGLAVGGLLHPQHLGGRRQRVPGRHRGEEAPLRIAQIGHGVQADVRHRLAEHHVEHQQRVERRGGQTAGTCEFGGGEQGVATAVQGRGEGHVAFRHRARRRVGHDEARMKILEIAAGIGFRGHFST